MAELKLALILHRATDESPSKPRARPGTRLNWLHTTLSHPKQSSIQPLFPLSSTLHRLLPTSNSSTRPTTTLKNSITTHIEDYEFGEMLGQGAYATVHKAIHRPTKEIVAIKTYERVRLVDQQRKKGVQREIRIQSRMAHPNVVRLMETIETQKQIHLVMEYVKGVPVYTLMKQRPDRRFSESEARALFSQLLQGLSYCHHLNVCHRDIKLENLLITPQNVLKIIDFGFATCFSLDKKVKMFCGTPNYMSPEILSHREFSGPPADIWAAGVVLYTMVSGVLPFKGNTDRELYQRVQRGQYALPSHVSPQCKSVMMSIFTLDPDKRPTANQLLSNPWVSSQVPERRGVAIETRLMRRESPVKEDERVLRAVLPRVMLKSASQKRLISREASPSHPRSSTHNP